MWKRNFYTLYVVIVTQKMLIDDEGITPHLIIIVVYMYLCYGFFFFLLLFPLPID